MYLEYLYHRRSSQATSRHLFGTSQRSCRESAEGRACQVATVHVDRYRQCAAVHFPKACSSLTDSQLDVIDCAKARRRDKKKKDCDVNLSAHARVKKRKKKKEMKKKLRSISIRWLTSTAGWRWWHGCLRIASLYVRCWISPISIPT